MRKIVLGAATAVALIGVAACNRSDPPAPTNDTASEGSAPSDAAEAIRQRQAHYKDMGKAAKAIGDELKADAPSLPVIQQNARRIADYAPRILTWFPAGSGPESGIETRAKPDIWSDQEGFGRAAAGLIAASEEFSAIAGTGDIAAIREARPRLGEACKDCHDRFRAPEDE